jgi:hypothetical protein
MPAVMQTGISCRLILCLEKAARKKSVDEMPTSSEVPMNETFVYVTTVEFMDWIKIVSCSGRKQKKVLLALDCIRSRCSDVNIRYSVA